MTLQLPPGPLVIDVAGHELTVEERRRLADPRVGAVILFARNYRDREQLRALTGAIHELRSPPLLIAIDHEGGRVQRCREGFSRLPAMRLLGRWWDADPDAARAGAEAIGHILASELRDVGVDLSFTPVLDLDWGTSSVIGDRSFHGDPDAVVDLAGALIRGLHGAGMSCCGKHFPGHGWVQADSHVAIPVDTRSLDEIAEDMLPYRRLPLDAVMPAHVIYPKVDARPAGFSPVWLDTLRRDLGFEGILFTDDLSMEGASVAGGVVDRVRAAEAAGCDMYLVCNAADKVDEVLANWQPAENPARAGRIARLLGRRGIAINDNPAGNASPEGLRAAGLAAIDTVTRRFA